MSVCRSKDICEDVDNGIKNAKNLPKITENVSPLPANETSDSLMLNWLNQIKSNAQSTNDFINTDLPNLFQEVEALETQLNDIFS